MCPLMRQREESRSKSGCGPEEAKGLIVPRRYRPQEVQRIAARIGWESSHCRGDQITDISSLANLTKLTSPNLPFNQISDLYPLERQLQRQGSRARLS